MHGDLTYTKRKSLFLCIEKSLSKSPNIECLAT